MFMSTGKLGQKFVIKVHICLPNGTFKPQRFSPDKNNVRLNWFRGQDSDKDQGDSPLLLSSSL